MIFFLWLTAFAVHTASADVKDFRYSNIILYYVFLLPKALTFVLFCAHWLSYLSVLKLRDIAP